MSIRIGFVGTGGIAQYHMNHLIQIEDAKIICGYDISKECLINASKRFGFIPYEDLDKMLDSETLDCVYLYSSICSWRCRKESYRERLAIFCRKAHRNQS